MEESPRKNKKMISDMVAPAKKKPVVSNTKPKEPIIQKKELVREKHVEQRVRQTPAFTSYQEEVIEENYENMEDPQSENFSADYSRFRNINMDSVMGESRRYGGCLLWMVSFICIIGIILGVGGLFARAHVTIVQKQWTGPVDQSITLAQNPNSGQIAFATETQTFTDTVVVPSTGTSAQSSKASGIVRFYNSTGTAKTIPLGTVILSSKNNSYITQKKIIIPAQKAKIPGQIDVVIVASDSGSDSDSGPDDFTFATPSKNFAGITIHSTTPLTGGASANTQTASQDQVDAADTQIGQYFADPSSFITRMQNEVPDAMTVLPIQIAPATATITIDGTQPDGVHINGTEAITILLVSKSDIAQVLGGTLNVPQNINIALQSFNNLTVTTATALAAGAIPQALTIHITGMATIVGSVDPRQIQMSLIGISRKQARKTLGAIPEIQSFTIKIAPAWRRVFPSNRNNITVTIK
jgi:hypothetical protein